MKANKDHLILIAIIGTVFCGAFLLAIITAPTKTQPDYYHIANHRYAEIIDTHKLTNEALENRNGKLIIERCFGVVEDAKTGKGYVINNSNFYISYASVKGIANGDVVCSYFIYNPATNDIDDILYRYDYIVD